MILVAFALQLACASVSALELELGLDDDVTSQQLYRRPTPPKPRIPGVVASERRYASSEPPMRLTASDGTGLVLRRLQVRGVIDDPVSLTELHLTFENPHDRTLDGQFELLLPHGAEVSRFAMQVGGRWVESEVVEREQAQQVYQAHKHTRRDPALLERDRGRRFGGRVFPIAPRERKQIILSYTTTHEQAAGVYRVPLAGLPRIDAFDLEVVRRRAGGEDEVLELHGEHEALNEDFTATLDGPASVGLAAGNQALLRLVPIPAQAIGEGVRPASLSVLVDTSASMASAARASEDALTGLLDALVEAGLGSLPVEILAFDQTRALLYRGTVADAHAPTLASLRERARLGASDLVAALDAVAPEADRVIVLGDGEVSAGKDTRFEIAAALERAHARGVARLDVVAPGRGADVSLLEWMVGAGGLEAGEVFEAALTPPQAWIDDLLAPPGPSVSVAIAGATEVWPASFAGLRPGESVVVHASFQREAPAQAKLTLTGAPGAPRVVPLRRGDDPLIARAIAVLRAKALIAELEAGSKRAASVEHELVELSKQYRILSAHTAMLVLESERAYAEFGIERGTTSALAIANSSITVDSAELEVVQAGHSVNHDFTAVVDLAPTAADAGSISLQGTTGAQSHYTLYGSSRSRTARRWAARARGRRLGPRVAKVPEAVTQLEQALDESLERCTRHVATFETYWNGKYFDELTLALRFDESARLVEARITEYVLPELADCIAYELSVLGGNEIDQRPDDVEPALQLFRRYHIEITPAAYSAPRGWHIPEAVEFGRERAPAGQSGAAGWARFIEEDIEAGLLDEALDVAWTWHQARPGEVLPYVSLGRALAAAGELEDAARAYGSLIDIHPARAETRRFAGALLESIDDPGALALAIDSYEKARMLRPDHPSGYQALALALARRGDLQAAVDTLVDALGRTYADGRFGDAVALMSRDLATLAAAAILAAPESRGDVLAQLVDTMIVPEAVARDWLTLTWETDASFLNLFVEDINGLTHGFAGEGPMSLSVTNGFGPQGFEWLEHIRGPIEASVVAEELGPEGVAMGCLRRVRFDGEGKLEFETRPFVIWPGQARVELGAFEPSSQDAKQ